MSENQLHQKLKRHTLNGYDSSITLTSKPSETKLEDSSESVFFQDFAICDFSRYSELKLGIQWRSKSDVATGKGEFVCGSKDCDNTLGLKTYEVFFQYKELKEKSQLLVDVRLCDSCACKLDDYYTLRKAKKEFKKHKK